MFTGIVQAVGEVTARRGSRVEVRVPWEDAVVGESVAVDGVCLTVAERNGAALGFDISRETFDRATLKDAAPGRAVNLERALRAGDALGGHFVQGHVDGVGRLVGKTPQAGGMLYEFEGYAGLVKYLAPKGSVAVDGVSLTVVNPQGDRFSAAVIPHTEAHTTLGRKKPGDAVNIEADMIAKHVHRLMAFRNDPDAGELFASRPWP
jgi:riboflavin synthase